MLLRPRRASRTLRRRKRILPEPAPLRFDGSAVADPDPSPEDERLAADGELRGDPGCDVVAPRPRDGRDALRSAV